MVDAARQKALFRAKLNASKKEKRIEDPLVRYNENDQPVCRVCDFVLKSDSHWPAHQASRKHHEAINTYRANAAALNRANNVKQPEASTELPKPKAERPIHLQNNKTENSTGLAKPRSSSVLPSDFFDNSEAKRQKNGTTSASLGDPESHTKSQGASQSQVMELFDSENNTNGLSSVNVMEPKSHEILPAMEKTQTSTVIVGSESKHIKGALPEGFFDDKDSDLRARGITPVKPDVKDEYKEFEKLIQEDLQEVDNRLEEEEFDAAETIEEAESVEQRAYKERVERLKRKKMELKAARSATHSRGTQVLGKESSSDESSSDDNSEENFAVDWRAKHL